MYFELPRPREHTAVIEDTPSGLDLVLWGSRSRGSDQLLGVGIWKGECIACWIIDGNFMFILMCCQPSLFTAFDS